MAAGRGRTLGVTTPPTGTWVQTERAAHEAWALLAVAHPRAAAVLHVMVARMGRHNALVISQRVLARLSKCSLRTVQYALQTLEAHKWIEVRRIGSSGTVNAYVINDRVAWSGKRDGIAYSLFSANVVLASDEQPDADDIGAEKTFPPLLTLPTLHPGEQQLPAGPGLPPPSQPHIEGLEPDLPARMAPRRKSKTATTVTRRIPMPDGAYVEMLLGCILQAEGVSVTADEPEHLLITAQVGTNLAEAEALIRRVEDNPVGWIERVIKA